MAWCSSSLTTRAISVACGCSLKQSCRTCAVFGAGASDCARRARREFIPNGDVVALAGKGGDYGVAFDAEV